MARDTYDPILTEEGCKFSSCSLLSIDMSVSYCIFKFIMLFRFRSQRNIHRKLFIVPETQVAFIMSEIWSFPEEQFFSCCCNEKRNFSLFFASLAFGTVHFHLPF